MTARITFVTGAQRSGTTLLQTLICSALPNAPVLPEAHLLVDTLRSLQRARQRWDKTRYFFADQAALTGFFRATIDAQIECLSALNPNAQHLVLKDPNFLSVPEELGEMFPQSAVVVSVRDPRDVVGSFMKIAKRAEIGGVHSIYRKRDIGPICKQLDAAYLEQAKAVSNATMIKYEKAATDPSAALADVHLATGLPVSDQPRPLAWLPPEARHQPQWSSPLEGGPPSTESIGSYSRVLSLDEVELVERLSSTLMSVYDYELTPRRPRTVVERALRYWRLRRK